MINPTHYPPLKVSLQRLRASQNAQYKAEQAAQKALKKAQKAALKPDPQALQDYRKAFKQIMLGAPDYENIPEDEHLGCVIEHLGSLHQEDIQAFTDAVARMVIPALMRLMATLPEQNRYNYNGGELYFYAEKHQVKIGLWQFLPYQFTLPWQYWHQHINNPNKGGFPLKVFYEALNTSLREQNPYKRTCKIFFEASQQESFAGPYSTEDICLRWKTSKK